MATRPHVLSDIAALQRDLRADPRLRAQVSALLRLQPWRPLLDVAFDLAAVALALWLALDGGLPWWPLALLVLGNRQRALGNLLHDASHRNLSRRRRVNDALARGLLAPLLFLDLDRYRALHFQHHLELGDAKADPDLIPVAETMPRHWAYTVARQVLERQAWCSSAWGHLAGPGLSGRGRALIVAWWVPIVMALVVGLGPGRAFGILAAWLLARMTVFHLVTTVREMCDHHGLRPGGVFSFARDLTALGPWQRLIHPRNNAYHLTHHLMPSVPYYRLPKAQRLFADLPSYRQQAAVCDRYVSGDHAVARSWQAMPPP